MLDLSQANANQRTAITTTEGPLLVVAGPGTGKTYTLVNRIAYLVAEKGVDPSAIMVVTFTEKAAKELVTRVSSALADLGITLNVEDMYIGTFHSVCLRLLKENAEWSGLSKNYRVIDQFEQQYLVFRNAHRFRKLEHYEQLPVHGTFWDRCAQIGSWANQLGEELANLDAMLQDDDPSVVAIAECAQLYNDLLVENGWLDFSRLQTECYRMLRECPQLLATLRERVQYVMVDEYQDTNYIQEQLALLIAGEAANLCVVGDDDQSLYRFRGATVRNILQFPEHWAQGVCKVVPLDVNYRSLAPIVDFYSEWMSTTAGPRFRFDWAALRHEKQLKAHRGTPSDCRPVCAVEEEDTDAWVQSLVKLVHDLDDSGKLDDFNQVAFLFRSVKHPRVRQLAQALEESGVPVYSPRSNEFFDRYEVRLALGLILFTFKDLAVRIIDRRIDRVPEQYLAYLEGCITLASDTVRAQRDPALATFLNDRGMAHADPTANTDYAFTGLLYQLFAFEPFESIMDAELNGTTSDLRAVRNLALLTNLLSRYEYLHRINLLTAERRNKAAEQLFTLYLSLLWRNGVGEYEDEEDYAPSGCVSFLTIHQAKGMEFPVVVTDTTQATPRADSQAAFLRAVLDKYGQRSGLEDEEDIKYFDFWRLYYTAFSRAQDLLVLAAASKPTKAFELAFEKLPSVAASNALSSRDLGLSHIKSGALKPVFSFTSHVALYENCPRQYKFFRELGFSSVRNAATLFGSLVHQTIEDVHKAVLRGDIADVTPENIDTWFQANYDSLSHVEHAYLATPQKKAALQQVQRYVERNADNLQLVQDTEVMITLVKPDYIMEGAVDLIRGDGDTVELVDFKAERKPDLYRDRDKVERYKQQLRLYAHLVEEKYGYTVSKLHLYYTGEESGVPMLTFSNDRTAADSAVGAFDDTAHRIMEKDFAGCTTNGKLCENCDLRHRCRR